MAGFEAGAYLPPQVFSFQERVISVRIMSCHVLLLD